MSSEDIKLMLTILKVNFNPDATYYCKQLTHTWYKIDNNQAMDWTISYQDYNYAAKKVKRIRNTQLLLKLN